MEKSLTVPVIFVMPKGVNCLLIEVNVLFFVSYGYTKLETPVPARSLMLATWPQLALGWVTIPVLKWML